MQKGEERWIEKITNYRNGLYQGGIYESSNIRNGFGLLYGTDSHVVIASTWNSDQACGPTLIFNYHGQCMYGQWDSNRPNGINVIKLDSITIYLYYQHGVIVGNLLCIFEKYNLAVVLTNVSVQQSTEFELIKKGSIYCDDDFQEYLSLCKWPTFNHAFKTPIRFIMKYLTHDTANANKKVKLRLINELYYRFGFDEGIAIIFDDEYKIMSAGLHRKAKLKSLGVKFTKDHFIQQGDFGQNTQVFAFNIKQKPTNKIGKLYTNHLLKSTNFVNKFITDPSRPFLKYFRTLLKENFFKQLLVGQITARPLDHESYHRSSRQKILSESKQNTKKSSVFEQSRKVTHEELIKQHEEEEQKQVQEKKKRLQMFKKQIEDSLEKKKRNQETYERKSSTTQRIINKSPVGKIAKLPNKDQNQKIRKSIFTPEKKKMIVSEFSPSPIKHSPFKQKMRSKIFQSRKSDQSPYRSMISLEKKNYETSKEKIYEPIMMEKQYQSPHQNFEFSKQQQQAYPEQSSSYIPLSIKKGNPSKSTKKIERPETKIERSSEKKVKFAPKLEVHEIKTIKDQSPAYQSSKNKIYLQGAVNYQPISTGQVQKTSYYEKFQRKKSKSPYRNPSKASPEKRLNEIVTKFNQSQAPYHQRSPQKPPKMPPQKQDQNKGYVQKGKKNYQYYFP